MHPGQFPANSKMAVANPKTRAQYSRFASDVQHSTAAPRSRWSETACSAETGPPARCRRDGAEAWTGRAACGGRRGMWALQWVSGTALAAGAERHRRLTAVPLTPHTIDIGCFSRMSLAH